MQTPIVFEYGAGRLRRADPPGEGPGSGTRFVPAHEFKARRYASIAAMAKGKSREVTVKAPDSLRFGSLRLEFERGICPKARWMPPEVVAALDEIDKRIAALSREHMALLEDGFARGRKVRVEDVRPQEVPLVDRHD
jgi:hypothetical protein